MKKLVIALILGILIIVGILSLNIKEAKAAPALCGFAADGVCCESGSACYCLPDPY